MMRALQIFVLCTFSYVGGLDIFIHGPVQLLDCRSQDGHPMVETTTFHDAHPEFESTTASLINEAPVDQKEFFHAARQGDLSFINAAIRRLGSSSLDLNWHNTDYAWEFTTLHVATYKNYTSIVAALLDAGADPDVQDDEGMTPVNIAAWKGLTGPLEQLLEHGSDLNKLNNYGTSPLMYASKEGHVEAVRMLIQAGAQVDYVNPSSGWTALRYAVNFYKDEVALLLLQNGADKNELPVWQWDSFEQLIDNY